jgi:hypothetical protein
MLSFVGSPMIGTTDIPEVAIAMPSAPGVTRRYTDLNAYTDEVANARLASTIVILRWVDGI